MEEECIFCNITKGKAPSKKVHEKEDVLAFLDINPVSKGHTLVIPKEHYHDIFEIPQEELRKVMEEVKKISEAVKHGLDAGGINILHNSGSTAQQAVPHFHVHVIPRYVGDKINIFPKRASKPKELDQVANKIKEALSQ